MASSRGDAAPTCGFLPLHLYEGPELDRAMRVCADINAFALAAMGIGNATPKAVEGLSLRDMLDALDTVERWNARPKMEGVGYSMCMVPAERLIAAVYTLVNFPLRPQDGDQDLIVRFDSKHWGTDYVNALVVIRQERKDEDEESEEAA